MSNIAHEPNDRNPKGPHVPNQFCYPTFDEIELHDIKSRQIDRFPADRIYSIVGLNTGDEGKGRVVPDLVRLLTVITKNTESVGMVFKVNGGANSGHTVAGLKHNLIPGGVTEEAIGRLGIGAGVVADPLKLDWEIRALQSKGYDPVPRMMIDPRAMVSDITHRLLDLAYEQYLIRTNGVGRGSTGRGISPAFCDETSQRQIHFSSFQDGESQTDFEERVRFRCALAERTIMEVYGLSKDDFDRLFEKLSSAETGAHTTELQTGVISAEEFDFCRYRGPTRGTINWKTIANDYWRVGSKYAGCIVDLGEFTMRSLQQGMPVLAEHGQAFWLDKRRGFSPNVTASHTTPAEIYHSLGISTDYSIAVIGCCKAYDTKVGTHRFLSEIADGHPLGERLKKIEFGTTTGRQRMVGWSDLVERGTAIRRVGSQHIALNKLDVLNYGGEWTPGNLLKLCVGYKFVSKAVEPVRLLHLVPEQDHRRAQCSPVYLELPAWDEEISRVRSFAQLPEAAQLYVAASYAGMITCASSNGHELPTIPYLSFLGVGPDPDEVILDTPAPPALFEIAAKAGIFTEQNLAEFGRVHYYIKRRFGV
jgi:adenylosuccinate synthase